MSAPDAPGTAADPGPRDDALVRRFLEAHPAEAAAFLEARPAPTVAALLARAEPEAAVAVLRSMAPLAAAACLAQLSEESLVAVSALLPAELLAALLRRLDAEAREERLAALPASTARALRASLAWEADSAGALADPTAPAFARDTSVDDALARLRAERMRTLYYLYVVDREQRLVGVLTLREVLLAEPGARLGEVMRTPVERLSARAVGRAILDHPAWRIHHVLPVVDDAGRFLGALRYKVARSLEAETRPLPSGGSAAWSTAVQLGELFWLGLAGVLGGMAPPPGSAAAGREGRP